MEILKSSEDYLEAMIAPVHVGKNAYIAAGSTVVEDVPEDALFVARARGVIKEDWVKRRKEQGKL